MKTAKATTRVERPELRALAQEAAAVSIAALRLARALGHAAAQRETAAANRAA